MVGGFRMLKGWFLVMVLSYVCENSGVIGAPTGNNSTLNTLLRLTRSTQVRNNIGNLCNCACGQATFKKQRILGGAESKPHEFPWIVGISGDSAFHCGGSLITQKHVLTAAHCLQGFDLKKLRVTVADHNRVSPGDGVEFRVRRARIHADYVPRTYNNDIAIIELEDAVKYNEIVQPVCLPEQDSDYSQKMGVVAGWGKTEERGDLSPVLKKLEVPVWSRQDCLDVSGYQTNRITENMFCAGYVEGGQDACQGDSGGPLHVTNVSGKMEIIGLVSWGRGCGRPKLPGLYTKVVNYLDWIKESVRSECLCSGNA